MGLHRVVRHLEPGRPSEVSQITIPETADENFAIGFGDLTVHEVEVPRGDPNEGGTAPDDDRLAYFSWYSGGFRVVDITDPASPTEVGHYIDPAGNNFWGVPWPRTRTATASSWPATGTSACSIFRYTGPLP